MCSFQRTTLLTIMDIQEKMSFGDSDHPLQLMSPYEHRWRARYEGLLLHGYQLRPRYRPNWQPSWIGTDIPADMCEDFIEPVYSNVLDAKRVNDNALVCIKVIALDSNEFKIARMLSPSDRPDELDNHCVPIIDAFPDPINPSYGILVMPYLHQYNKPYFETVEQVMDFIQQTLEGLSFLHRKRVAHRDCWTTNIMMDGDILFPRGHHPISVHRTSDFSGYSRVLRRSSHSIKYYFIDFGMSSHFEPGESPYVLGEKGANQTAPELSTKIPYNAFMLDVYILGHAYHVELLQEFVNLDFLQPLVTSMTDPQPEKRLTAEAALSRFHEIRNSSEYAKVRWRRAVRRNETAMEQVVNTISSVISTITSFKLT
ncbi:kinase-like domain-containing protein [Cristinia sonorae]|uniref:Kinase-like domain-containing protein n=1 Tax=Cristinia sonorae TaxID=1940300 RepID=A0A8K0XSE8_9AGAR|nr:kinase-like domain-containing protein [Cristinia sonorae]